MSMQTPPHRTDHMTITCILSPGTEGCMRLLTAYAATLLGLQGNSAWPREVPSWHSNGILPSMWTCLQAQSPAARRRRCGGCVRRASAGTTICGKPLWQREPSKARAARSVLATSPVSAHPWQPRSLTQCSSSGIMSATRPSQRICCPEAVSRCTGAAASTSCPTPGQLPQLTDSAVMGLGAQSVHRTVADSSQ